MILKFFSKETIPTQWTEFCIYLETILYLLVSEIWNLSDILFSVYVKILGFFLIYSM